MFTSIDVPRFVIWIVSAFALVALVCDLFRGRIYNALTVPFAIFGLVVSTWLSGVPGLANSGVGLLLGLILFFPLFLGGVMGGGDVKFLAAVGAWVGMKTTIEIAVLSVLFGGLMALLILVFTGKILDFWRRVSFSLLTLLSSELRFAWPSLDKTSTMPFGIPMAVATILVVWVHPLQKLGVGLWF